MTRTLSHVFSFRSNVTPNRANSIVTVTQQRLLLTIGIITKQLEDLPPDL